MWGNLNNVIFPDGTRSAWYMVIHDIIPKHVRLHLNRLIETDNCTQCGRQDTILYGLTEQGGDSRFRNGPAHGYLGYKDGPKTYTQGMAPSPLFQTVTATNASRDLWFLVSMSFYVVNHRRILWVLDCNECMR